MTTPKPRGNRHKKMSRLVETEGGSYYDCHRCGRIFDTYKQREAHYGSKSCSTYAAQKAKEQQGLLPVPKTCRGVLTRNGISFDEGSIVNEYAKTRTVLWVPPLIAKLCTTFKGRILNFAIARYVGNDEFRDALHSMNHIDEGQGVLHFVMGEWENRPNQRKRKKG